MRCFFHLRGNGSEILDEDGVEVGSVEEARTEALKAIGEMRREDPCLQHHWNGWRLTIVSDGGQVVSMIPLNLIAYPMTGGRVAGEAKVRPSQRVQTLIDAFNDADLNTVVDGCANDIELEIPMLQIGDLGESPTWTGKDALQTLLTRRQQTGVPISVSSISDGGTSAVAIINSSRQGQLAVTSQFNAAGLVQRLVVSLL
jgi:hypothetical protein